MPPSQTRIVLLGRIAIEQGDRAPESGLAGRRAETVFAYLAAHHGRTVSRDVLATALWPEVLPDTWNAALRSVLSDVRRFLERGGLDPAQTLLTEQGGVRLALPEGVTVDLDEARGALATARDAHGAGDASTAAACAETAADLAELPFLAAHDDEWAAELRGELDRLHTDALALRAESLVDAGDPRGALVAADRLVRADPYLEAAHRLRITLLGRTGDRAGARKAYERCAALLASELGLEPSAETAAALREAVGEASAAVPGSESPLAGLSVLVVEDHDFQRRTTLSLLRGLGVGELHEASDGAGALRLLDGAVAPDVVVCDIDMPGMDGVEFIRHVAERGLVTAVVFASGLDRRVLDTVRAASEGYGLQVLGAVGKPLTAASLERLLGEFRPDHADTAPVADTTAAVAAVVDALDDGSLTAMFEPIVDLAVGRITGLDATLD
ncbi:MAG: BTAD domain-containing putative transcriptional regulator, partial [Solirubrobacteraceae bacterium]